MTRLATTLFALALACAPALAAEKGVLTVRDDAGVFSKEGVERAVREFEGVPFRAPTSFAVVTSDKVPEAKRAEYDAAKGEPAAKARFFSEWAAEEARANGTPDVLVLINMEGTTVRAIADRRTDVERGFASRDARELQDKFLAGFKAARSAPDAAAKLAAHDDALVKGAEFVALQLKDTTLRGGKQKVAADHERGGAGGIGGGLMGYVCVGLCVLLGVWVVVGLFRMMSGGGGGGYGGGMGGGMGGGGFMSGLMGGMLGAVAGHYLYDNFFGGGSTASAADGMAGADNYGDTGAGDYAGGADGGGGDFGDSGGGDFGGGDFGGGDFGGGDW